MNEASTPVTFSFLVLVNENATFVINDYFRE